MFRSLRSLMLPALVALTAFCASDATAGGEFWRIEEFWHGKRKPTLDVTYGAGSIRHRLLDGKIDRVGTLELKLGYTRAEMGTGSTAELTDKYLFMNYASADLFGRKPDETAVQTDLIRFGFGGRGGYAYDFTSSYLYPYTQTTLQWGKATTRRPAATTERDEGILDRYEGSFRFGTTAEAGLAFGFGEVLALRAGYEVMVLYPRHVFWPWVGSYGIAMAGMSAVSHFGEEIVEASPALGPVLYTLLRGGLVCGYYLLVRDNQYWPFSSETPLTAEGYRLGFTLTF